MHVTASQHFRLVKASFKGEPRSDRFQFVWPNKAAHFFPSQLSHIYVSSKLDCSISRRLRPNPPLFGILDGSFAGPFISLLKLTYTRPRCHYNASLLFLFGFRILESRHRLPPGRYSDASIYTFHLFYYCQLFFKCATDSATTKTIAIRQFRVHHRFLHYIRCLYIQTLA